MRSGVCVRHWPQLPLPQSPSLSLSIWRTACLRVLLVFLLFLFALSRQASKVYEWKGEGCIGGP